MTTLTYEQFLDEIATLLTEMYELDDEAAIKLVVDAQADDYFVAHDDHAEMRTLERAKQEATALFEAKRNKKVTHERQQLRARQKKT